MEAAAVMIGKGYRDGGGGVRRHFAVGSDKRASKPVGREIYIITVTISLEIGDEGEWVKLSYIFQEDVEIPGAVSFFTRLDRWGFANFGSPILHATSKV